MDEGRAERRRKRMEDSSSAIATKLLQGWTMLNDHCPQCLTPLVRNRERRMYCVSCCQWVVTDTEAAARVLENRVDTSQNHEEAAIACQPVSENGNLENAQSRTTVSSPVRQHGADASPNQVHSFIGSNRGFLEPTHGAVPSTVAMSIPNSASQAAIDGGGRSNHRVSSLEESGRLTSLGLPKVDLPPNTGTVFSQTVSVLIQKIEEMSQLIAATHDPQSLKQLLEILGHCIRVIQQIASLSTSNVGE